MKRKIIALLLCIVCVVSLCFPVAADDDGYSAIVSDIDKTCPTCGATLHASWGSTSGAEVELEISDTGKVKIPAGAGAFARIHLRCSSCGYEKTETRLFGLDFGAEKPGKLVQAPSGIGRKDLPGYADDNGTPNYNSNGFLYYYAPVTGWSYLWGDSTFSVSQALYIGNLGYSIVSGANSSGKNLGNPSSGGTPYARAVCEFTVPVTGNYYVTANQVVGKYYYGDPYVVTYAKSIEMVKALQKGGKAIFFVSCSGNARQQYIAYGYGIEMYIDPVDSTINKQTTITINNNTWNGNIYVDNSTNLTYIYPPVHHHQREERNCYQHFQYAHHLQQRDQTILHLRPDHEELLLHNLQFRSRTFAHSHTCPDRQAGRQYLHTRNRQTGRQLRLLVVG